MSQTVLMGDGTFLLGYVAAAAAMLALVAGWRRLVMRGAGDGVDGDGVELAFVAGGDALAVSACGAGLRLAGALALEPMYTVKAVGKVPAGAPPLMRALHRAARAERSWAQVVGDAGVQRELERTYRRLVRRGWLLSESARKRARAGSLGLFLVAAGGVWRLGVDLAGGAHAGPLVVGLVFAVGAALFAGWQFRSVGVASRAGRRVLRGLRKEGRGQERSVTELVTAVALFGTTMVDAVDPDFAAWIGVATQPLAPVSNSVTSAGVYYSGGNNLTG